MALTITHTSLALLLAPHIQQPQQNSQKQKQKTQQPDITTPILLGNYTEILTNPIVDVETRWRIWKLWGVEMIEDGKRRECEKIVQTKELWKGGGEEA